jgi:hypothetical protein
MATWTVLFLALACGPISTLARTQPCPFNNHCSCTDKHWPQEFEFSSVDCVFSGAVEPFSNKGAQKYKVDHFDIRLIDAPNAFALPANYFEAFDSILWLSLFGDLRQDWHDDAFIGVNISNIYISRIKNPIPPPTALKKLGQRGDLRSLGFAYIEEVQLTNGIFSDFQSIETIDIGATNITKIEDDAFQGLEKNLKLLSLEGIWLKDFPTKAVSRLVNLEKLELEESEFTNIAPNSFSTLQKLRIIDFDCNGGGHADLDEANEKGAFASLPDSVELLSLEGNHLRSFPKVKAPNSIHTLSVSGNQLTQITKEDISQYPNLMSFDIATNPIDTIEQDSIIFPANGGSFSLVNTGLKSIDLSIFDWGVVPSDFTLDLSANAKLETITVSDAGKISSSVTGTIRLDQRRMKTGLKTIDQSIDDLLTRIKGIKINIDGNENFVCKGSEWLAYYLFCSKQLSAEGTQCADQKGMRLESWLWVKNPDPCQ